MSEQWSDEDYFELFNAMRSEHQNTRNKVQTGPADAVLNNVRGEVYVVIFNEGTQDEGVYTLQSQDDRRMTHLLTFENTDDANRFASMLQGQGLNALGKASAWDATKTMEYCLSCEYAVTHVPVGTMFSPPESNTVDEEAFRARREMMNHGVEGAAVDQMCGQEACGLDEYLGERENFERLFRGFSP
jgi:hypothetical protein